MERSQPPLCTNPYLQNLIFPIFKILLGSCNIQYLYSRKQFNDTKVSQKDRREK